MFLFGDDYFLQGKKTAKAKKILINVFESSYHHSESEVKTRMFYLTGSSTNTYVVMQNLLLMVGFRL